MTSIDRMSVWGIRPGSRLAMLHTSPAARLQGCSLPAATVRAGDTGTIPYRYRGTNFFNRNIARADSAQGSGYGSPMYFVNSWALGWSRHSRDM